MGAASGSCEQKIRQRLLLLLRLVITVSPATDLPSCQWPMSSMHRGGGWGRQHAASL